MAATTPDPLFTLRNNFYLGAYQAAINNSDISNLSEDDSIERDSIVYRSYIALGNYQFVINEVASSASTSLQAVKLLAVYLSSPDQKESTIASIKELLDDATIGNNPTLRLIAGTIFMHEQDYNEALKYTNAGGTMELCAFNVHIFLKMHRSDYAEKQLKVMQQIDEDHTLTQLATAWFNLVVGGSKIQEAYLIFKDFSEKYQMTCLILNGKAVSRMKNFDEAESFLLEALNKLVINEVDSSPLQAVELLGDYLLCPDRKEGTIASIKELLGDAASGNNPILRLIAGTIFMHEQDYNEALKYTNAGGTMELYALNVHIFLKMHRSDYAEKELKVLQQIDEDHTLTQLATASFNLAVGGSKIQEAYLIFQDFSEKYQMTSLILNGKAVSCMHMGNFDEAESFLLEALNKDGKDREALANMVVCSVHLGKPSSRFLSQLKLLDPEHVQEIIRLKNGILAEKHMAGLQVMLEEEKYKIKATMYRVTAPMDERHVIKKKVTRPVARWERQIKRMLSEWAGYVEDHSDRVHRINCKLLCIASLLQKDLPASKRDEYEECFSSLIVEAETTMKNLFSVYLKLIHLQPIPSASLSK